MLLVEGSGVEFSVEIIAGEFCRECFAVSFVGKSICITSLLKFDLFFSFL